MIFISKKMTPELRHVDYLTLPDIKYDLLSETEHDRCYIILSFKCPCKCQFCNFRFLSDTIKDCSNQDMADKVQYILKSFPDKQFSFSVTGGEPFLSERRARSVLDAIYTHAGTNQVRWVGFGTSGIGETPRYLNNYSKLNIDIYLSRHHYEYKNQLNGFGGNRPLDVIGLQSISGFKNDLKSHISVKLTCNLIKGGIDNINEIKKYLEYAKKNEISSITFRELNKIDGDATMYTDRYIIDYISYYKKNLVTIDDLLIECDPGFKFISQDIRPFIYHEKWKYEDIEVTFRRIDEAALLNYNETFSGIDEIVVHPDGLITGCWDRNQKVLLFGRGENETGRLHNKSHRKYQDQK